MFEKEAEEYAKQNNPAEYGVRATHFTVLNSFKDGAEFGYNKAKEEMQEQGLALQSDMDKTIEQNIQLKKQNNWLEGCKLELAEHLGKANDRISELEQQMKRLEEENADLEEKISILLSCKNCPNNKGGYICQKEYKDKCLAQKIQYIKELKEENAELRDYRLTTLAKQQTSMSKYALNLEHKLSWYDDQLTKAKELLKDITSNYGSTEVSEAQLYFKIKRAEQFLKENE